MNKVIVDSDIKKQIADLIQKARKAKGLTQEEIAERVGVAKSTFSLYESGRQNLTLDTLQRIATALDMQFEGAFK